MFVLALVVGPLLGLLAVTLVWQRRHIDRRITGVVAIVLLLGVVASGIDPGIKAAMVGGVLLGALLATTPMRSEA